MLGRSVLTTQECSGEELEGLLRAAARFEEALASFKGTILAVVHDRYFIERFASEVWNVHEGKIQKR